MRTINLDGCVNPFQDVQEYISVQDVTIEGDAALAQAESAQIYLYF